MKKKWICIIIVLLFIGLSADLQKVEAASSVTTKILTYKGQEYVQLSGADQTVTNKLNKSLKRRAVNAAISNSELKRENKSYYYRLKANTKYNDNKKISVMYTETMYSGGAHELYGATVYNYDLQTGKPFVLMDYIRTQAQRINLKNAISNQLQARYDAGAGIFEDNIYNFSLNSSTPFYFYQNGIAILFNPYEVAAFSEGVVIVKVPFDEINKGIDS
ncbi:DUF3298 and DUF4163 domain-containing protein [Paenibacillus bovis]|uniref:DUF3298 domain-containing protein n=1 Tax=Paenibacillus bovis TaxID=1616788 RepID=A0A172ZGH7_9BACL|nr:DUF3298 and DUF4163 domain-containing protein [Paenibacillus bovis]ANF96761.1 hypothetical protein AR543_12565 [Paenibacillus bovis]